MCSTCGCAEGERHIEGDEPAQEDSHHVHDHTHPHGHVHGHTADAGSHEHTHGRVHGHIFDAGAHGHTHPHGHFHVHEHTPGETAHEHSPVEDRMEGQSSAALAPRRITLPGNGAAAPLVIHHHHYHAEVHHHYYNGLPPAVRRDQESAGDAVPPATQRGAWPDEAQHDLHNDLHYGRGEAGVHAPGLSQRRLVDIEIDVLDKNNRLAAQNRERFLARHILALNLVSSPGSGKTTLLTETLQRLKDRVSCAVIEGDQQTTNDADRIRATGAPAIQVNTGKGCHLDAQMILDAAQRLAPPDHSLLFIENVGNLVCPAGFDLGERHKVVVLSVTEGEDKPLKYPHMFAAADVMILNKTDLLPWVNFNVDACITNARRVNPAIKVLMLSATTGEGMQDWIDWLDEQLGG